MIPNEHTPPETTEIPTDETPKDTPTIQDEWMIRPCLAYDGEYYSCVSIKSRIHQYFIYGETLDCNHWKTDSRNCYNWVDKNDVDAAKQLVASEKKRKLERLLPHYQNDIWKKRKEPPNDWAAPLPEQIQQSYKNSYLDVKSKEMKGELPAQLDLYVPRFSCTIL